MTTVTDTIYWEECQMASKAKVLKSKEVAHILDCSPDDVIMLARKGKLRAKKEGKYWLYRYADVMRYRKRAATA
jgi:hypothetical protein